MWLTKSESRLIKIISVFKLGKLLHVYMVEHQYLLGFFVVSYC